MHVFYSTNIDQNLILLEDQEATHCWRVLRHKVGDIIMVTDGSGQLYKTRIVTGNKKEIQLEILNTQSSSKDEGLPHIAISIIKNTTRLEWFIEKATEIGISAITPLICHRTEKRSIKKDRLNKIAISAMKQSGSWRMPTINDAIPVADFVRSAESNQKFIASYSIDNQQLINYSRTNSSLIMIGPEGDFNQNEVHIAKQEGFTCVNLGNKRLRVETAGLVACTILNMNL